jgi:hypothetical protein
MRERADLIGGRLDTGVTAEGRWRVRLELPVEAETDVLVSRSAASPGPDAGPVAGPVGGGAE